MYVMVCSGVGVQGSWRTKPVSKVFNTPQLCPRRQGKPVSFGDLLPWAAGMDGADALEAT